MLLQEWVRQNATYMQFSQVINAVKDSIRLELESRGNLRPTFEKSYCDARKLCRACNSLPYCAHLPYACSDSPKSADELAERLGLS